MSPTEPPAGDAPAYRRYWRATLRRTTALLAVWLLVGPILGILLVDRLNTVTIANMPLGFWVAQQGAIYVFVVLIFLYAWRSQSADRDEEAEAGPAARQSEPR